MQKEKVNTHFSFPLKLDMSDYVEKTLLPQQYQESVDARKATESGFTDDEDSDEHINQLEYNLIGVTVHTGNADGGHYYSFIKERNALHGCQQDRWFLFNDAEVKQFDPSQIEAECFGGEMTSKTYDTVTEKYLDFSFEKTNSAYMLFYERCPRHEGSRSQHNKDEIPSSSNLLTNITEAQPHIQQQTPQQQTDNTCETETVGETAVKNKNCDIENKSVTNTDSSPKTISSDRHKTAQKCGNVSSFPRNIMSKELEEWIWEDNRYFLQDRNIFEHTYFK